MQPQVDLFMEFSLVLLEVCVIECIYDIVEEQFIRGDFTVSGFYCLMAYTVVITISISIFVKLSGIKRSGGMYIRNVME